MSEDKKDVILCGVTAAMVFGAVMWWSSHHVKALEAAHACMVQAGDLSEAAYILCREEVP